MQATKTKQDLEHEMLAVLDGVESGKLRGAKRAARFAEIRERIDRSKREREGRRRRGQVLSGLHQFALRLRMGIPPAGQVLESDIFKCEHFGRCEMEVRHCLERQGAKWPGGNRLKDGSVREKKAGVHTYCASGVCEQGKDLAERCSFRPEFVWSKGRYSFFRKDSHEQREAARVRRKSEPPGEARADLSPFQEAALLSKDDPVKGG